MFNNTEPFGSWVMAASSIAGKTCHPARAHTRTHTRTRAHTHSMRMSVCARTIKNLPNGADGPGHKHCCTQHAKTCCCKRAWCDLRYRFPCVASIVRVTHEIVHISAMMRYHLWRVMRAVLRVCIYCTQKKMNVLPRCVQVWLTCGRVVRRCLAQAIAEKSNISNYEQKSRAQAYTPDSARGQACVPTNQRA